MFQILNGPLKLFPLTHDRVDLIINMMCVFSRVAAKRGWRSWAATRHKLFNLFSKLYILWLLVLQLRLISLSLLSLECKLFLNQVRILPGLLHLHFFQLPFSLLKPYSKLLHIIFSYLASLPLSEDFSLEDIVPFLQLLVLALLLLVCPDQTFWVLQVSDVNRGHGLRGLRCLMHKPTHRGAL